MNIEAERKYRRMDKILLAILSPILAAMFLSFGWIFRDVLEDRQTGVRLQTEVTAITATLKNIRTELVDIRKRMRQVERESANR